MVHIQLKYRLFYWIILNNLFPLKMGLFTFFTLLMHIYKTSHHEPFSCCRFLYRHLLMFFSKTANLKERSVFQHSSSGLLSLKSGITLHLYVNQLPKGAAQIPSKL